MAAIVDEFSRVGIKRTTSSSTRGALTCAVAKTTATHRLATSSSTTLR